MSATKDRLGAKSKAMGNQLIGVSAACVEAQAGDRLETAQVELKRQNRAEEGALRDLLGASLQGVLIATKRHRPLLANQSCAKMFGFASPIGITALSSIENMISSPILKRLGAFGEDIRDGSGATNIHEFDGVRKDGSTVRLKSTAKPIEWQGHPAVLLMLLEISGPESAENDLLERKAQLAAVMNDDGERLRDFAEIASDWFWEADENLRFTYFSGRHDDIGLEVKTTLGKTRLDVTIEDATQKKWRNHHADLIARQPFKDFRYVSRAGDGRVIHLSVSGKPLFDEAGNFTGYRGTGTDISAEVDAKKAAVSVQEQFMAAIDAVADGFALFDAEDRMVFCNSRFKELNPDLAPKIVPGMSFEKMLRENVAANRILDAIGDEAAFIRKRMELHRNPRGPLIQQRRDGRWLELREERMADGSTFLVNTDITERMEAEEKRKKSEERFRDFSELASDWLWEMDENLRFGFVSSGTTKLGVKKEVFLGSTLEEARHVDCDLSDLDEEMQMLRARKPYRLERPQISVPEKWLQICARPLFSENGTFVGYRGATSDITERKRAEIALQKARDELESRVEERTAELRKSNEALMKEIAAREKAQDAARNSENHLRTIVDKIADGIITIGNRGIVESVSASAEKMFGYKAEELLGRNISILMPEPDRSGHDGYIRRYIETGQSKVFNIGPREVIAQKKDGSTFPMELTIGEMRVGGKHLFVGAVRDITKRREAESALHRLSARLISAQEDERSRIARELHDDFNQRLALLAIDLERFHDGLPSHQTILVDGLASLLRRTKELSSDVHRLSHQLHPSILQHLGLVAAVRSFCKEIAEQHDIQIELAHHEISRSLPREIALCLYRIVQEALRNVIKHSGAKSARVEITKTTDDLLLQISDNGVGFDLESDRPRQGLGLLSMRERLRQVDGSISFERSEPTGTRIDVRIPFKDSNPL